MLEELETLTRINTVLNVVPLIVLAGVTRIFVRQRQLGEEVIECKKKISVLEKLRDEDAKKIERLQDFQERISERRD